MLLLVSFLITSFTAYQINRFIDHKRLSDWFVGQFLITWSLIVFVFTFAGLVYCMNRPVIILLVQLVIMVGVWFVSFWLKKHHYSIPKPKALRTVFKDVSFFVILFVIGAVMMVVLHFVYVIKVPPNNNDALMWHLSRVTMWYQTGSWLPWTTPVLWQLTFPFNGEMVSFWTLLFLKREWLIAILPLISGVFSSLIIFQFSDRLFKNRSLSWFVAVLWLSFPVVHINLSSSKHDHPSTFLLLACLYFFFCAVETRHKGHWILSGLSLALSVGTNLGVATYLPGLFFFFLFSWVVTKKIYIKDLLFFGSATILFFLLLSAPVFISNIVHFQSPLGPDTSEMTTNADDETNFLEHFLLMNGRWAYQFFDCVGFSEKVTDQCRYYKAVAARKASHITGLSLEVEQSLFPPYSFSYQESMPLTEDSAWYSLTGGLMVAAVGVYAIVKAIRKKEQFFVLLFIFIVTIPLTQALLWSGWKPWDGRYFMLFMALFCIGGVDLLIQIKPVPRYIVVMFMVVIGLINIHYTIEQNPGRTIYGDLVFWEQTRLENLTIQAKMIRKPIMMVEWMVPEDATLAIDDFTTRFRYEYGYFGETFSRTLIYIYPRGRQCDAEWLEENNIEYLLIGIRKDDSVPCALPNYSVHRWGRWLLYLKDG